MRPTAFAVNFGAMAGVGARVWSASAANRSAMRDGYCGEIKLTHQAVVRPLGTPGGDAG